MGKSLSLGVQSATRTVDSIYDQIENNFECGEEPEQALSMCDMWSYDKKENNGFVITGMITHGDIAVTTVKLFKTYGHDFYLEVISFIKEPKFYGGARKRGHIGKNDACVTIVDEV